MMVRIQTFTGYERHTSNGAKGVVFVFLPPETPIWKAAQARPDILHLECTPVCVTNGQWKREEWEVPDGTTLILFSASTWRGTTNGGGTAWFTVDARLPRIRAEGEGYQERIGSLTAPMRRLALEEIEAALGHRVDANLRRFYRTDFTLTEVPEGA